MDRRLDLEDDMKRTIIHTNNGHKPTNDYMR